MKDSILSKPPVSLSSPVMDMNDPWGTDKLGRKEFAPLLTDVVAGEMNPFVIAVNGKWGSGKTFFLKRWCRELVNDNWAAVYFDAWQDDFLDDPLLAIIGQLHEHLHEKYAKGCAAVKLTLKDYMRRLGKMTLTAANGFVEHATGVNAVETVQSGASEIAAGVEDYLKLGVYRSKLVERIGALAQKVYQDKGKPLVVVVDELDRCKPTFAVALLERIKHLFHLSHVVFVLGVDKIQLGNTIKSVYGEIDVENYLRRFIDLEFDLPDVDRKKYIDHLYGEYGIEPYLRQFDDSGFCLSESHDFTEVFSALSAWNMLELREIESAIKMFMVFVRTAKPRHYSWPILAAIMIVLRLRNRKLYDEFVEGTVRAKEIINLLAEHWAAFEHRNGDWAETAILKVVYASYTEGNGANKEIGLLAEIGQLGSVPMGKAELFPDIVVTGKIGVNTVAEIASDAKSLNRRLNSGSSYDRSAVRMVASRLANFRAPY